MKMAPRDLQGRPTAGQGDAARLAALRRCWQRWTAVVDLFARRRVGRGLVDPQEYSQLHREVVETCERLAATAEGDGGAFYERLASLARPWLDLELLAHTDQVILLDLLLRCRQAEAQLGGHSGARAALRWAAALGLLGLAGLAFLAVNPDWSRDFVLRHARDWANAAWSAAKRTSPEERFMVAGGVVALGGAYLVSRTRRS